MTLEAHQNKPLDIDLCEACHGFWFDKYESLKLSPGSTLKLIKLIGELSAQGKPTISENLQCPRCNAWLLLTRDMQRSTRFSYWRCDDGHGRFIGFFDFLREKNFVRTLSQQEIDEMVDNLATLAKRPVEGLQQASVESGGVAVDLDGGYAGVILARPTTEGGWETRCVFTFEEGAEFLGIVEENSAQ